MVNVDIVDRKDFVPEELLDLAYEDRPLPIGEGQTISQPTTVRILLEMLECEKGMKALDIGAGSGWVTALLSVLVGGKGAVFAYEIVPRVGEFGKGNLERFCKETGTRNIKYTVGDYSESFKKDAPYDRIVSGAAFKEIPKDLLEALSEDGGILVSPTADGSVHRIVRKGQKFEKEVYPGFVFVPITGKKG